MMIILKERQNLKRIMQDMHVENDKNMYLFFLKETDS